MQFGVFVNFGVAPVELRVQNWSSWLRIGAHGFDFELMVHIWSSRFTFGAHSFDLDLMAQRVRITSFFGHAVTRVFGHATGSWF